MPIPRQLAIAGRLGAGALLSKTPNQRALAEVHKGLAEVPFGQALENFFMETTGRDTTGGGSGGGLTPEQATQLSDIQGNAATAANGLGGQSPGGGAASIADAVWSIRDIAVDHRKLLNDLSFAGDYAYNQMQNGVYRDQNMLNFLTRRISSGMGRAGNAAPNLNLASSSASLLGESDLAMLTRLYPGQSWTSNYNSSPYVGAFIEQFAGVWSCEVYYVPLPPTLDQIFHLWDYLPSSGYPIRNGITDYIRVLTLLPLQF